MMQLLGLEPEADCGLLLVEDEESDSEKNGGNK